MGGRDVLFVLGVVALIILILDGKRRSRKRAVAFRPAAVEAVQDRVALLPRESIKPATQTANQTDTPLPALPAAALAHVLPSHSGSQFGSTLLIQGKVDSGESLAIHGTIEGSVTAREHSVNVAASGRVCHSIEARVISVAGRVTGRLVATDQALLLSSARVNGSIDAKRLKCEAGAWLKVVGSVNAERSHL